MKINYRNKLFVVLFSAIYLSSILYFVIDERSNIVDLSDKGRNELSPDNPDDFVIPDLREIFHDID